MSVLRFRVALAVTTLAVISLAETGRTAAAEQPEPKLRTFMIVTAPEDFPDLESEHSQFVVTHAGQRANASLTPTSIGTADCSPLFPGRNWWFGGYITHVTSDGPQRYFVLWLDEIPPQGAIAYTGPEGDVIGDVFRQRNRSAGECDSPDGDWIIETSPNSGILRYIATGWFSR